MSVIRPGDVVVCVDARPARWHEPKRDNLVRGRTYRVARFVRGVPFGMGFPRSFIVREGESEATSHWDAYRFRKIEPSSGKFACAMRELRPTKKPVPA